MSLFKKMMVQMTGNRLSQKLLTKIVKKSQYYMGIASGDNPNTSGEKAIFDIVRQRCQPPYIIFDVGANKGQYLDLILKYMGADPYTVHCFEPSSSTFSALTKNAPSKNIIKLNNVALGKQQGEMRLFYNEKESGLASLSKRRLDHFNLYFNQSEIIKIDTVDNYCQNNQINRINLLKMDVEGHELDVLFGAADMLKKRAIDIITFEFGGCNIDSHTFFQDFYYFFKDVGMNISRITPSGYLYPLDSYNEILEQFRTTNFVAMKD